jgi:hypothetical protein
VADIGAAVRFDDGHLAESPCRAKRSQPHALGSGHSPFRFAGHELAGSGGAHVLAGSGRVESSASAAISSAANPPAAPARRDGWFLRREAAIAIDDLVLGPFDGVVK